MRSARAERLPEKLENPGSPRILAHYETSLRTRFLEGERNRGGLFHEMTAQRYSGSRMTVERFLRGLTSR